MNSPFYLSNISLPLRNNIFRDFLYHYINKKTKQIMSMTSDIVRVFFGRTLNNEPFEVKCDAFPNSFDAFSGHHAYPN